MVVCTECATQNTLDSLFCRKCGTAISEAEIEASQIKLDRLIAQGTTALNEGRTEDAVMSAESALEANPTMIAALALLADARTRKGDLAGAIEVLDQIVELSPDSELDRIKRNKLREKLQESIRVPETPNRALALTAAIASVIFVGAIGAIGAKFIQDRNEQPPVVKEDSQPETVVQNAKNASGTGTQNPESNQVVQNPSPNVSPDPSTVGPITQNQPTRTQEPTPRGGGRSQLPLPPYNGGSLPEATDLGVQPVRPPSPSPTVSENSQRNTTRQTGDPDPEVKATATAAPQPTEPEPDPGEIEIRVRNSGGSASGGSVRTDGAANAMMNTARQQQLTDNMAGATGSLEKARDAGADPVFVNQRLGMNYARAGKKAEAIDAYQKAISAGNAALASGRGDKARVQKAIDFCNQALKVLKSG
jgi:tetratricopeptide (TPR) repeat protein